jgi:hypothetical protein
MKQDYFFNARDNIYLAFGTRSFFKMLLPSLRALPLRGLEWSFESLEDDPESAVEMSTVEREKDLVEQSFELVSETTETSECRSMIRANEHDVKEYEDG